MRESFYEYDPQRETRALSKSVTDLLYGEQAPHKKVARKVFTDHAELTYIIATCNTLVGVLDFLQKGKEAEWTMDEMIGEMQIALQTRWKALSSHKLGFKGFNNLDIDKIIHAQKPSDYLDHGFNNPVHIDDTDSLRHKGEEVKVRVH